MPVPLRLDRLSAGPTESYAIVQLCNRKFCDTCKTAHENYVKCFQRVQVFLICISGPKK